jgi:hypothetical protein
MALQSNLERIIQWVKIKTRNLASNSKVVSSKVAGSRAAGSRSPASSSKVASKISQASRTAKPLKIC